VLRSKGTVGALPAAAAAAELPSARAAGARGCPPTTRDMLKSWLAVEKMMRVSLRKRMEERGT
jgi:hypothetical protein